jgi:geranylgeranyl diphosphate synthase type II
MDLAAYLSRQADRVNRALDRIVPPPTEPPASIHKAMRYSLFAGGKRIRPILAMAAAEAVGGDAAGLDEAACALELIHTYSLIHDDLPALDNDDLRRGRPTNHKVFGEAMAILAGDALLTLAFQLLASAGRLPPERRVRLVGEVAAASGTVGGMIGGQVFDIEGEGQPPTAHLLDSIHRAKTGALLCASVRFGAIYVGAEEDRLADLSRYGTHVGLAFQIVDDILDVTQTPEQLGKTPGKDLAQGKITFPAVYGVEASREMAEQELGRALAALDRFGPEAEPLADIARLVVAREA